MEYSILTYGADPTGNSLCTEAFRKAVEACKADGGGTVIVPAGTYKTGTIWLGDHVELHLCHGALIVGSDNIDDLNEEDAYPQNYSWLPEQWVGRHLIIAHECTDVAITGTGIIDCSADKYFAEAKPAGTYCWMDGIAHSKDKEKWRPGQHICFIECTDVRVTDITVRNTTCWCCFVYGCDNVIIRGMKIYSDTTYANSDGIDIDCCYNVTISDCIIDTGDDCIAIRGSCKRLLHHDPICENVTITNCVLASSSSVFRIGVGVGTIRHVAISNLAVHRGATVFNVQSNWPKSATFIDDVNIMNVAAKNVSRAFNISASEQGAVKRITIDNCKFECCAEAHMISDERGCINDVAVRNIEMRFSDKEKVRENFRAERGESFLRCKNIEGLELGNITIKSDAVDKELWSGPEVLIDNCTKAEPTIVKY